MIQGSLSEFCRQIDAGNTELKSSLEKSLLCEPKQQSVHQSTISHTHHFHKGIWIAIGLFTVLLFSLYGWLNCCFSVKQYKCNDIRYRYLKVYGHSHLLSKIFYVDSIFDRDKNAFTNKVIQREKEIARIADSLRVALEKKK